MPDDDDNQEEALHGGKRSGAGRPRGSTNRRTTALREAIAAEGIDPAVALVRIGKAAEAREEFGLAVEAYGKVLPFLHAKPRTAADAHPEEALEFARAMLTAKLEAAAKSLDNPSLAERLARAKAKVILHDDGSAGFSLEIDPTPAATVIDGQAQPAREARQAASVPSADPAPAAALLRPILPRHDAPPASADWMPPAAPWPDRPAFADLPPDNPFEAQPYTGGLTDAYK